MVRFENVGLRYGLGPEVLRDLNFRIEPHSFQFLTGPSGAGKSSLMRLLFLALRPTRGLITLFGHDIATLNKDAMATLRRRIGVVFQDFRLIDHMTTYENVALPLRVIGQEETSFRDEVAQRLLRLFVELNKSGTSIVIATHDIALMDQYDARRLVLHEGRIHVYE